MTGLARYFFAVLFSLCDLGMKIKNLICIPITKVTSIKHMSWSMVVTPCELAGTGKAESIC